MAEKNKLRFNLSGVEKYFNDLYGEITNEQKERYINLFNNFKNTFNEQSCYIASSSGRVEICGNHTDHNGGKVVSCAISLDTLGMFLPTSDNIIHIKSEGYNDIIVNLNDNKEQKQGTSGALVQGICYDLKEKGYKTGGFKACFTSNVIGGAGISSSASFEVLVVEILNFLYNDEKINNEERAKTAQFAENKFFGKPCGLLDQTAISFGGLKLLDFKNEDKISVESIDNTLSDYTLILVNTGGSHENLTDEYASIPAEMKSVANCFGKERLIEVSEEDFLSNINNLKIKVSDRAILRCIHFYNENKRVENVYKALNKNDDYNTFLNMINLSGKSSLEKLQNCYVPSGMDQSIPLALSLTEKHLHGGANRVHGGGFAGCILNIVKNDYVEDFINSVSAFYNRSSIIPLKVRKSGTCVI